jgi:hypothetical protein
MQKIFIALALVLFGGCANSPTPNYDARFGDAVRQARQMMIINPNAGTNPDPMFGLDGVAAREAAVRYQESFQKPPPVVNVINIGGGIGGGGGGR